MHGKEVCRACGTLISQCRCMYHDNVTYGVCEKCKGREIVSLDRKPGPPNPCPYCGKEMWVSIANPLEKACQDPECKGAHPRVPGPPVSGECGDYNCAYPVSRKLAGVCNWNGRKWWMLGKPIDHHMLPLHDYPLRPGDEFRALEEEIVRLKAELASTSQVLRDTTKAHEDLMAECDQDRREARREGWDAGRDYGMHPIARIGPTFHWDTFEEWEASRERGNN